jgi:acylphosphatase
MEGPTQFRAIVQGRVHGVYFRSSTMEEARALRLAGYARNLPDGTVEVVAAGPRPELEMLIDYLHRGPDLARVTGVQIDWGDRSEAPHPFAIRY